MEMAEQPLLVSVSTQETVPHRAMEKSQRLKGFKQ